MTIERTDPPLAADEATMLVAFLEYHRDTLRQKADGLTAEQLHQSHPPSALTLSTEPPPLIFMSIRSPAALGTSSNLNLKLPRTGPTPTLATASKWVGSWTVTSTTSGMQCPTQAGSVMAFHTVALSAAMISSPLYCRFTVQPFFASASFT